MKKEKNNLLLYWQYFVTKFSKILTFVILYEIKKEEGKKFIVLLPKFFTEFQKILIFIGSLFKKRRKDIYQKSFNNSE